MLVPRGWSVKTIGVLPMFFSFDPGDSIPVIHLPEGGATINMEIESEAPRADSSLQWLRTLRGYATAIAKAGGATDPVLQPVELPVEAGTSQALMASWDLPMRSPETHHTVMVCWEFRGKLLDARLHYVKGDPKGTEHEKVFFETVRSFRPAQK